MELGACLQALRKQAGLSQTQAADYLTEQGLPMTQRGISKWERGDTQPNGRQFLALCRLYRVRDVLAAFCGLAPAQPDLLAGLTEAGRERVREYASLLKQSPEFGNQRTGRGNRRQIPLYDLPVSAGTGQFLDGDSCEMMETDDTVPGTTDFALRISGDSMSPRFAHGQLVFVRQQPTLRPGEIGIFVLNGEAYCKRLGEGPRLISLNPRYAPIPIGPYDAFRVLGKVLG